MNQQPPEQLIALLAQLVADGVLTVDQATEIGARWREIDNLDDILSMAITDGVLSRPRQEDDDNNDLILLLLLAAFGHAAGRQVTAAGRTQLAGEIAAAGYQARIGTLNALQDAHAAQAQEITARLFGGQINVSEWQAELLALNQRTTAAAAELGASGQLSPAMVMRIERIDLEQAAYLQRFADELAGRRLAGQLPADVAAGLGLPPEWSEAYVSNRAGLYSGASRSAFFDAYELDGEASELGSGYVVYYWAQDDRNTCTPCSNTQGPYLIGANPHPGQVCLGEGNCRCWLEYTYDLAMYESLGGY